MLRSSNFSITHADPVHGKHPQYDASLRTLRSHFAPQAGADLAQPNDEDWYQPVSLEITRLSASFPFGTDEQIDKPMEFLFDHLPPEPRAWSLCETYMEQATWAFRPIKRDELIDDILSPIYKVMKAKQTTGSYPSHSVAAHTLGTLFLVFACGALVDLTLEPCERLFISQLWTLLLTSSQPR